MASSPDKKVTNLIKNQPVDDQEYQRLAIRKNSQQALLYMSKYIAVHNQRFYTKEGNPDTELAITPQGGATPIGRRMNYEAAKAQSFPTFPLLLTYSHEKRKSSSPLGVPVGRRNPPIYGWKSGYANINPVLSFPRDIPGYSAAIKESADTGIARLTGLGEEIDTFFTFKITPAQMAFLVPKIQLYKLDYELHPTGHAQAGEVNRDKDPTRREIKFEKAITKKEMAAFELKGGNLGSSGINSFTWALKGVNPAEVDSNIEATLQVYFNNINVFQETLDELARSGAASGGSRPFATFLDLITFAPPTLGSAADLPCMEKYEPSFFEIEAVVGWDVLDGLDAFTADEIQDIKDQTVSLYLTLTDHKFDFHEDGTAELEVNYRARSTMSGKDSYNILKPRDNSDFAMATQRLDEARAAVETLPEDSAEETTDTATKLLEKAEEQTAKYFKATYKSIIAEVIRNAYTATVPNALLLNGFKEAGPNQSEAGGLLTFSQFFSLLGTPGALRGGDYDTRVFGPVQAAVNKLNSGALTIKVVRLANDNLGSGILGGPHRTAVAASEGKSQGDKKSVRGAQISNEITDNLVETSLINYVYLGDILEIMFESADVMVKDIMHKKIAVVLTDFKFVDYFKLIEGVTKVHSSYGGGPIDYQFKGVSLSKLQCRSVSLSAANKKDLYSVINLANVPINLELFIDFFITKVIGPQKTSYDIESFLTDFLNGLVKPILSDPGVFGTPNNQPAMININIDTSKKSTIFNKQHVGSNMQPNRNRTRHPLGADRALIRQWLRADREFNNINPVDEYTEDVPPEFILVPTNPKDHATVKILGACLQVDDFAGNYVDNAKASVKNFVIGLDRGIVKSISFERVDQPYLREARTAKSKNFGTGQLRELYHANLVLYGNNLLRPGQLIYVEANSLIFGRPVEKNSAARVLGLGGYHLVVDVENEITMDGWETTVKALHMSMPALPAAPVASPSQPSNRGQVT